MVGIMMMKKQTASNWWWLDSHTNNAKRSPWLQSTLSDLDEKTEAMLKLIEEDADSFAKRAEMYYKKRPELIGMVEDFYRAHRSLAERYDQIKSETPARLLTSLGSPFSGEKPRHEKPPVVLDRNYDSYSETFEHDENAESEVEDPDEDGDDVFDCPGRRTPRASFAKREDGAGIGRAAVPHPAGDEVQKLKEEVERLRAENRVQREQLEQKDEEKREVIRQLSLAVELLKDENVSLKKSANSKEAKKRDNFEVVNNNSNNKVKGGFLRKLFSGSFFNSQATVVAL